ncbi:nucleoside hydrolase [Paraneptunicella aestuarii]|uniref:nucleoside hydrolase n=1 Tax=Paraneptunicella aestuarii TaxID=2831148 RepID=UPI001E3E9239|nr:nucleoside hydrolase [Paraneptunicella aestuarii]UAA39726.1 nucleoside hydrolase [Paraneptunicella aestuarii]
MLTNKRKVIFDHDGGIDDLLSLVLLLTMEDIDLLGVTITPADCFLEDATESTLKILSLFQRKDIKVAKGNLYGVNPFHYDWRAQPKMVNALPTMLATELDTSALTSLSASDFIIQQLQESEDKISILMTGPCSNLVKALETHPELKDKVDEVIWMGGAVDVKGNVAMHNHDGSAEWNVYWDPYAANNLFKMGLTIKLVALDATNCLPIDMPFLKAIAAQRDFPLSELAGQFWAATITSIPSYEYTYHLWDVMATSCLEIDASAIQFEKMELDVSIQEPNQGHTIKSPGNGQWIDVAVSADREKVLDYVLKKFRRGF